MGFYTDDINRECITQLKKTMLVYENVQLAISSFFKCSLPSKCVPRLCNVEVLISFWQMLEAPQCGGQYFLQLRKWLDPG